MDYAKTFYLLIEIVAGPLPATSRPVGPMEQAECKAIQLAIESAAVPSVVGVECREARFHMACEAPGKPGAGYPCPDFTPRLTTGRW